MASAVKGFAPSQTDRLPKLLVYAAICSVIAPCMLGIALSQKLHQWPRHAAMFQTW